LLDPSYPALALGAVTAAITSYVYRQVEVQRSQIRGAFSQYLAPAVVEEIIANPTRLELGGTVRELTLMFCDVRNFTSISEQMNAAELTQFINELLSPLTDTILERRGTIDKYMGDAIMAFWNAPLDDPDHASHACGAAIEMASHMGELNRVWEQRASAAGRPFQPVKIGIGINTGECCVGNLGSTHRFDYSAIGDEVNITSRFEGLSKIYGLTAIVGDRVLAKAPDFSGLEIDLVQVKGRTRAVRVHTFADLLGSDRPSLEHLRPLHSQFLAAYRGQAWDEAERLLGECRRVGIAQLESCYLLFMSRIATLRHMHLPPDWDGAFAMTEK
jgi:adenylate cyclase